MPEGELASVSAGAGYACGIRTDGSVACWGDDRFSQGTLPEGDFASVSAGIDSLGASYACGVRTDGSVACWGDDYAGEATPPEVRFTSVSAGVRHICGVRTDGSAACWGDNRAGQATPLVSKCCYCGQGASAGIRPSWRSSCHSAEGMGWDIIRKFSSASATDPGPGITAATAGWPKTN